MYRTEKRKSHMTEGIELPNQEKIRKLGEIGTDKYLRMLEADNIKQWRWKKKWQKSTSGEGDSYSKPSFRLGISSRG